MFSRYALLDAAYSLFVQLHIIFSRIPSNLIPVLIAEKDPFKSHFDIRWETAFSSPSMLSSNIGKISRMAMMVRV